MKTQDPMPTILAATLILAAPAAAFDQLAVITTDYETYGAVTGLMGESPWTADIDMETISADAVGRWHDGLYWIVNRGGSNIQVLDPANGMATVRQFSVGVGRNPQDIAFAPDGTAWVSCYDEAVLLQVDPVDGTLLDALSTAAWADTDGLPETSWMLCVDDRLFITCQRLDRDNWWGPTDHSLLLVCDLVAKDWVDVDPGTPAVDGILLSGTNPSAAPVLSTDGRGILLGCNGWFGVQDGGIERVDRATSTSLGYIYTEAELGGDVLDVEVTGSEIWTIVSDPTFATRLLRAPADGSGPVTLVTAAAGYDHTDVIWDGAGLLFLADRALAAPGVRVFSDATGAELTASPIGTGRPPFMILTPADPRTTSTPEIPPVASAALRAPWPNPANPRTRFDYTVAPEATVALEIVDMRGRRLRELFGRADATGAGGFDFDGLDDAGRPLASGAFRAVLRSGGTVSSRGFVLAR